MVKKFRKKPVDIQAVKLEESNILEVYRFINGENSVDLTNSVASDKWDEFKSICKKNKGIRLKTLESDNETQIASFGDFIIKGIQGEFYPCKPEIFLQTYEEID